MKKPQKAQKLKKQKTLEYKSVMFISGVDSVSDSSEKSSMTFICRLAVKVFLVCFSSMGFCTALAEIYHIPIYTETVMAVCFWSVIAFNAVLLFFRKRILFIPIIAYFVLVNKPDFVYNADVFINHLLHVLDSRLLSTADMSAYTVKELEKTINVESIAAAFVIICVCVSLVFTIAARSRYIGFMTVIAVFGFTPAFAAEIAGYVDGLGMMFAGMFGLYAIWAAHAWDNYGGELHLGMGTRAGAVEPGEKSKKGKRRKKREQKQKQPLFSLMPGSPPKYYKHSRNAVIVVILVVCSINLAALVVPGAVRFDASAAVTLARKVNELLPKQLKELFYGISSDLFPDFTSKSNISNGIGLDNASSNGKTIIRVTLEDDSSKMYFRGGIGIDFTGDEWTIAKDEDVKNSPYNKMMKLIKTFSPETESRYFLKFVRRNYSNDRYMGRQEVKIEYLSRTGFLLLPAQPYSGEFKEDSSFDWHLDTFIRPKKRVKSTTFDVVYAKEPDYFFSNIYEAWVGSGFEPDSNTLNSDDFGNYRELVHSLYSDVPDEEYDNITTYLDGVSFYDYKAAFSAKAPLSDEDLYSPVWRADIATAAQAIQDDLRMNYRYSLKTNNTKGDNTVLGNFLYDTKSGHCAMYASVMTLAMRRLGYPARYVTGVASTANGGKVQDFAERDFHAWVEVYFDGVGWIPYDPTGGVNGGENPYNNVAQTTADVTAATPSTKVTYSTAVDGGSTATMPASANQGSQSATATDVGGVAVTTAPPVQTDEAGNVIVVNTENPEDDTVRKIKINKNAVFVIAIPLLFVIAFAVTVSRAKRVEDKKRVKYKRANDSVVAEDMYRFTLRLLKYENLSVKQGETPVEFAARVDGELPLSVKLADVMPIFEKLEFSDNVGIVLNDGEYKKMNDYFEALYEKAVREKNGVRRLMQVLSK